MIKNRLTKPSGDGCLAFVGCLAILGYVLVSIGIPIFIIWAIIHFAIKYW